MRRFAAVSLKDLKSDKDVSKVSHSVLAIVEAWEVVERDKAVRGEGPGRIKRIGDYLEELSAGERAAGEVAAAYEKAKSAQGVIGSLRAADLVGRRRRS